MQIVNIRYAKELKYIDNKVVINFNIKTSSSEEIRRTAGQVAQDAGNATQRAMRRSE